MSIPEQRSTRRRGRPPGRPADKREFVAEVWFTRAEFDAAAAHASLLKVTLSQFVRLTLSGTVPRTIPAINQEAWVKLARAAANVNQISRHMNRTGDAAELAECKSISEVLAPFRAALIGALQHQVSEETE